MTYASQTDMAARYGMQNLVELTDRADPSTGELNTVVLASALADADALIDAYAGRRYAVPLSPVPAVVIDHACAIAYYKLHRDRYPDEVRKAYDDALSFLGEVTRGNVILPVPGVQQASSAPADARVSHPDRTFSRDNLKGF